MHSQLLSVSVPVLLNATKLFLQDINLSAALYEITPTGSSVLQLKVLIFKFVSVDALSTSAVMVSEVASLTHEAWNDTVE